MKRLHFGSRYVKLYCVFLVPEIMQLLSNLSNLELNLEMNLEPGTEFGTVWHLI